MLRTEIRRVLIMNSWPGREPITEINFFGRKVPILATVNKTCNNYYRTYFPEPRVMCPSIDIHRPFTKEELECKV